MPHTFHYRKSASQWGVFVSLTAEAVPLEEVHKGGAEEVAEGLWISIPDGGMVEGATFPCLSDEERGYLRLGLKIVAGPVRSSAASRLPLVVRVRGLAFNECDFQPEGLACAVAGWAAAEFGFPPVPIPVSFYRKNNRYVFDFEMA